MSKCNPNFFRALWPAFLVALPGTALLFSLIDPADVMVFGAPVEISRAAIYSIGFAGLWLLCWTASVLNLWLFGCRRDAANGENGEL
jgi:hypothetical protein